MDDDTKIALRELIDITKLFMKTAQLVIDQEKRINELENQLKLLEGKP